MWIFHSSKAIVEEAGVQAGSFLFSSAHLASDVGSWYPEGLLLWLLICTAFMCFSPMLAFWIIKMQDYYQTSLFLGNSNSAGRLLLCVCVCVYHYLLVILIIWVRQTVVKAQMFHRGDFLIHSLLILFCLPLVLVAEFLSLKSLVPV